MTTYYSQRPYDIEPETTCSGFECAAASALDHALVFAWFGLAALVLFALVYLPKARERCEEERTRTRDEVRAFEQFARRVDRVDAASPQAAPRQSTAGPAATLVQPPDGGDEGLRAVRDAYRETFMAVPHYEDEYDEPLSVNVAEEFDPGAATALADGNRLTPHVKQALVQCTVDARDRREQLLDVLDNELASIDAASDAFGEVETSLERLNERPLPDRSFDELVGTWREVRRLGARVEDVVEDRQTEVQSGENLCRGFSDPWSMYAYIYQSIRTNHPILREGARLLEDVSTAERRIVESLTRRV